MSKTSIALISVLVIASIIYVALGGVATPSGDTGIAVFGAFIFLSTLSVVEYLKGRDKK